MGVTLGHQLWPDEKRLLLQLRPRGGAVRGLQGSHSHLCHLTSLKGAFWPGTPPGPAQSCPLGVFESCSQLCGRAPRSSSIFVSCFSMVCPLPTFPLWSAWSIPGACYESPRPRDASRSQPGVTLGAFSSLDTPCAPPSLSEPQDPALSGCFLPHLATRSRFSVPPLSHLG